MDLSALPIGELQKLRTRIDKEIESRSRKRCGRTVVEIKSIAAKFGLKLEEVMTKAAEPRTGYGAAKTASKSVKGPQLFIAHPENTQLTWAGGRSRPPQWFGDWKAFSHALDQAWVVSD